MKIEFTVYGKPQTKGRPRFARVGGFVKTYTPKETLDAEQDFKLQALSKRPKTPIETEITLKARFYMPIPKSMPKKKLELALAGLLKPTTKPDLDNLIKLVKDALNGIYWRDDSLIVSETSDKYYSVMPRTEIEIVY